METWSPGGIDDQGEDSASQCIRCDRRTAIDHDRLLDLMGLYDWPIYHSLSLQHLLQARASNQAKRNQSPREKSRYCFLLCLKFLVKEYSLDEYRLKYQLSAIGVKRENKDGVYDRSYSDLPPAQ